MTRGDEMMVTVERAIADLERLHLAHYGDEDVRRIVEDVGSRTEQFFKAAVFPGLDSETSFDTAINRLKGLGFSKTVRGQLHALRELYNDAKHDPSKPVRLKVATDRLRDCRSALADLIAAAPGQVRAAVETAVSRLLWISGYDHYTGGCTSVYVSLPLPHDVFATHVDVFWLHHASWELLKADLLATGSFFYGSTHFEPDAFARFNEDDFINAGVWDGDYRLLVTILARHEHRPLKDQLISSLRRDHMFISVLSAIILARVDVVTTASRVLDEQTLSDAILSQADTVYAMPDERPWVRDSANALSQMIVQIPFAQWAGLKGPFWNLWTPKDLAAHVQSPDPKRAPFVIDDANRIVIT